ncbi:hypothetical protein [Mucilaginibacter sp.]|uniref:hypothetical protein n=1 Tax=Mucilaginibacter sp. TaxID=1882438 RepID=UPI0035BBAFCD
MKHYLLCTTIFICLIVNQSLAQSKSKKQAVSASDLITNSTVVSLHQAGLDDDLIISKLQGGQAKFDLSAAKLIDLKNAGISNGVIKAMFEKNSGGTVSKSVSAVSTPKTKSQPVMALDLINQLYAYNKTSEALVPLEKGTATLSTKYGFNGIRRVYSINGDKSPIRIKATDSVQFLINTGGGSMPELNLYLLKADKKSRGAASEKMGFGGTKAGQEVITYSVQSLKPGVYQLTPSQKLLPGEYYYSTKPSLNVSSIEVFAFGID